MITPYFLKMIRTLRQNEEIMLYGNILHITDAEAQEVVVFLKKEYESEALNYPYSIPSFDDAAALWAAKTVYVAAQLILYRETKNEALPVILPDFTVDVTPGAILSCDLCLRFLPAMIVQLKVIDSEDELIQVLENILQQWHYSGINYPLESDTLEHSVITADKCLQQLYANRIIDYKKLKLAKLPGYKELLLANMGLYAPEFWNEFKTEMTQHE